MKRRCPVCQKVIDPALQKQSRRWKFYPFCSQRCKLVDLGRWLDGNYRIVTKLRPEDSEGAGEFQVEGNKDKNSGQSEMDGG